MPRHICGVVGLQESGERSGKPVHRRVGGLPSPQGHDDPSRAIGADDDAGIVREGVSFRVARGALRFLAGGLPLWGKSTLRHGLGAAVAQAASPSLAASQTASRARSRDAAKFR